MRVLAIDVGYRNFAWCVVDEGHWREPCVWQLEDWWPNKRGKPSGTTLLELTDKWLKANAMELEQATTIVLERQMTRHFTAMNAFIASRHWGKIVYVAPNQCGAFWKLPGKRAAKKATAIARTKQLGAKFPEGVDKLDDLADAWLMAVMQLKLAKRIAFYSLIWTTSQSSSST